MALADAQERMERAKAAGVPHIYFNGFTASLGTGDVVAVVERNGEPVAVLNLSYTIAKSVSAALGQVVAQLEDRAGREILTAHDVEVMFTLGGSPE